MSSHNENLNIRFVDFSAFNIIRDNAPEENIDANIELPILKEAVISEIKDNEGIVGGMSLLLEDSNEKFFTLYVSTLKNYMKYLHEISDNAVIAGDGNEDTEDQEPVMVLPFDNLDREKVFNLIKNLNNDYLRLFAVKQIEESQQDV